MTEQQFVDAVYLEDQYIFVAALAAVTLVAIVWLIRSWKNRARRPEKNRWSYRPGSSPAAPARLAERTTTRSCGRKFRYNS